MNLDRFSDLSPVEHVEIVHEDAAVRITHLHGGDRKLLAIHLQWITHNFLERRRDRHRYRVCVELRLAQLRLEHKLTRRGLATQEVTLQSGSRAEPQFVPGPNSLVIEIGNGATGAIAGKPCFTAIGIEDAATEIGFVALEFADDRDAIATRAVVPVADPTRKVAEILDVIQLLRFEDEIVVSQTVKFGELWLYVICVICGLFRLGGK